MKTVSRQFSRGIALVVVMIAITVLSILAAGFAFSMKVETRLAQNSNSETELIWLGRSGVEFARWVLAQSAMVANEPYDSLNQKWAGGPGSMASSNSVLASIDVKSWQPLGDGKFKIAITDLERKYNINMADEAALDQALRLVGVDAGDSAGIAGSILDWIDPDDNTHVGGTESDFYQSLDPPYFAKNQPIDDLSELLLIRGVTPEMFFGGAISEHPPGPFQNKLGRVSASGRSLDELPMYAVGLKDIFTPISSGQINVNTASQIQLQMIPFVDESVAARIIELRSGPDGADGTEDDTPAGMPGADVRSVLLSAGMNTQAAQLAAVRCTVRSSTYEVQVDAEVGNYKRQFTAILARDRANARNILVVGFHWKS